MTDLKKAYQRIAELEAQVKTMQNLLLQDLDGSVKAYLTKLVEDYEAKHSK